MVDDGFCSWKVDWWFFFYYFVQFSLKIYIDCGLRSSNVFNILLIFVIYFWGSRLFSWFVVEKKLILLYFFLFLQFFFRSLIFFIFFKFVFDDFFFRRVVKPPPYLAKLLNAALWGFMQRGTRPVCSCSAINLCISSVYRESQIFVWGF